MDVSEDVVFCILLWLPVSTLLRFKAVCKSWRSLIESSDFVTKHLHHNHQDHDSWDLITVDVKVGRSPPSCHKEDFSDEFFSDVDFTFLSGNNFQNSRNSGFNFRFKRLGGLHHSEIITSCDGIIFVELGFGWDMVDDRYNHDLALWNPATRQFRTLPYAPVGIPTNVEYRSGGCYSFLTYGLGFDVKTNDYKVVRILIDDLGPNHYTTPVNSRIDVYSLSTNSWKNVDAAVLPVHSVWQNPYVPFRNGIYCWLGTYQYDPHSTACRYKNLIFSFDFGSEEFGSIPLPDVYVGDAEPRLTLSFLKENIACLVRHCPLPHGDPTTDIWVLQQYGVADSWSKLYTVTLENFWRPSGISKNGKIFWGKYAPEENPVGTTVNLSDPVTHESNILPIGYHTPRLQVAHYKESLVSIKSAIGASAVENDKHVICF